MSTTQTSPAHHHPMCDCVGTMLPVPLEEMLDVVKFRVHEANDKYKDIDGIKSMWWDTYFVYWVRLNLKEGRSCGQGNVWGLSPLWALGST